MAGLVIDQAVKAFGATPVLKGVSLAVEDGEFCVIVGASGCGKSTLLRAIAGLDQLDSGSIAIGDRRVDQLPPAQRGIAMVFQSYANHDREIDPAELAIYESQIAPEIRVSVSSYDGISSGNGSQHSSGLSSDFSKTGAPDVPLERDTTRRGAGRFGLLATPNPVASTDANLNRGISAEEFGRAARERFMLLDANHDGLIRLDELPSLPSRTLRKSR